MKKLQIYLLMASFGLCSIMDARSQNNSRPVRKAAVQQVEQQPAMQEVVEKDSHNVVVYERPVQPDEHIVPSVDVQEENNDDGSVTKIVTTVEQQGDKEVTTKETWTKYLQYAGLVGLATAAWYYHNHIVDKFNELDDWLHGKSKTYLFDRANATLPQRELEKMWIEKFGTSSKLLTPDLTLHGDSPKDHGLLTREVEKLNFDGMVSAKITKLSNVTNLNNEQEKLTDEQQAKLDALALSGGFNGKLEAEKISNMVLSDQQKALDDIKNIDEETAKLRFGSAVLTGAVQIPVFSVFQGLSGYGQGTIDGRYAVNNVIGLTNLTKMEKAKIVASMAKEGAKSAVKASLRSPITYAFAASQTLYDNVNPETAQASMDATNKNIDVQELYQ